MMAVSIFDKVVYSLRMKDMEQDSRGSQETHLYSVQLQRSASFSLGLSMTQVGFTQKFLSAFLEGTKVAVAY